MSDSEKIGRESLNLAIQLHQTGNFEEAEKVYRNLMDQFPEDATILNLLGVLRIQMGETGEGVSFLEKSVELNPEAPGAHYNLARAWANGMHYEAAIESYERAVKLKPDYVEAWNNLGITWADRGYFDEALKAYDKGISIDLEYADLHFNRGNALSELDRMEPAISSYEKAIELNPEFHEAFCNLAWTFCGLGKMDEAREAFKKALAIKPDYVNALNGLGLSLEGQNKTDEARGYLQKSFELDPQNLTTKHILAALNGENPESPPKEYVQGLFDMYASKFDRHLIGDLDYQAPKILSRLVEENYGERIPFKNALDLGCGTGLCGEEFRGIVKKITGVDVSRKMVQTAQRKKIYDFVGDDNILVFLKETPEKYDLFIAGDVFIYVGKLDLVFQAVKEGAEKDALLTFSAERLEEGDFSLLPTGRYAHSRNYIQSLAKTCGFEVKICLEDNLRKNGDQWLTGDYYVLRYTG